MFQNHTRLTPEPWSELNRDIGRGGVQVIYEIADKENPGRWLRGWRESAYSLEQLAFKHKVNLTDTEVNVRMTIEVVAGSAQLHAKLAEWLAESGVGQSLGLRRYW